MAVTFTKEHHLPHESRLAAYNAATSEIVWQQDFSEITGAIACNPATNVIYVPSDTGLSAFDAVTGLEIWYYTGEGAVYTPSVANGVVYAISETAMLALDERSGTELFSFPLGASGGITTQVAIADGMLYFCRYG